MRADETAYALADAHAETGADQIASSLGAAPLAVVIDLVRSEKALTRPRLVEVTGLSRKVVTQRVDQAIEVGLVSEVGLAPSGGGRQARMLQFNRDAGRVYGVIVGASEMRVAVADLGGRLLDVRHEEWSVETGPDATMTRLKVHLDALAAAHDVDRPWGIGIGLPGPVEIGSARLVDPPIMPGWDGFNARAWLREHYDAPVWVDNDVNLMAIGEWAFGVDDRSRDMLFVKAGTGIGSAFISRGRLLHGERGAAGDIGHIRVTDDPDAVCRCGQIGCLEAVAGGWSLLIEATRCADRSPLLARAIAERGRVELGDVGVAARAGDPVVRDLVARRAAALGEVAANLVTFANPGQLVIGGGVLRTGPELIDLIASTVRARSTRMASELLTIRAASFDQLEGVMGAAYLAAESLLAPSALARWVEDAAPFGHAAALQRHRAAFV